MAKDTTEELSYRSSRMDNAQGRAEILEPDAVLDSSTYRELETVKDIAATCGTHPGTSGSDKCRRSFRGDENPELGFFFALQASIHLFCGIRTL